MSSPKSRFLSVVLAGLVLLLLGPAPAGAALSTAFDSAVLGGDASHPTAYLYTYHVDLDLNSALQAGNPPTPTSGSYVTLYNLAGLISGTEKIVSTVSPTTWGVSEQTPGITPNGTLAFDGGSPNVTVFYTGTGTFNGGPSPTPVNVAKVVVFSFDSTQAPTTTPNGSVNYSAWSNSETAPAGTQQVGHQFLIVPTPLVPPTPEPASLVLLGMGLPLAVFLRRKVRSWV